MKTLIEEVRDILTPHNGLSLVQSESLFQLQPLLPLSTLVESAEEMPEPDQKKILAFIQQPDIVIFNGILYAKTKELNFKGRLQEIITVYLNQMREVVGDKKALIDVYDRIPVEDIINLIEDHVIFVMVKFAHSANKGLAAIRYLPKYRVEFEGKLFEFPPCIIAIHIDSALTIDNPEVISDTGMYEHPFVFRDNYKLGQKICMGTFYDSKDKIQFNSLRFANNINSLMKQAVQILVAGYNRGVSPANGHLDDIKFQKYRLKK